MAKSTKKSTEPEQEIIDWQAKAEEHLAGWKRSQADLENHRRRTEDERRQFAQFAEGNVILQLLPVLDNFKRAAAHIPNTEDTAWKNWAVGISAVEKQFEMILQGMGITEVAVQIGQAFDPSTQEAIAAEESEQPADTILAVIEPGYMLHGKLLRPAKVKVSKSV